ncbi:uncharacterized protein LOC125673924 [Ostrea edulis]|uniref:uncharacterized protein LOC125673924 n=1 Tax=Ostrea edulis TaxID=37623 RepID=UPI002094CBE2|nr:uncharacterized protein LOC125673924 [Ostrea edulis]
MMHVLFLGPLIFGLVASQSFEVMEGLLTEINQCKQIRENLSELKTEFSDMEIRGIHRDMRLKILTSVNVRLRAELRRIIQTNDLLKDKLRELAFRLGEIKEEKSEIKVQNATGEVGEGGKQISCSVTNHKNWTYFNIERNGQTVVHVSPDGRVQTRFNQKYLSITPTIRENLAEINISFASLRCSDEGLYRCVIDGREQPQNIAVVVKSPSTGKPDLSKIGDVIGYKTTEFNCEGSPKYPHGNMEFQIKLQNETLFRVFKFPDTKVFDRDRNCVRKQSISVTHVFTDAWNQARIRCKFKHSQDYDETQVFVISPSLCEQNMISRGMRHPYKKTHYVTCDGATPTIHQCPDGTCFDEVFQTCADNCLF